MPLPPDKFKERIERIKRNTDIKAVIESTGAQPATSNASNGQHTYHAPYRDDSTPSLTIYTQKQTFVDFGMTGAKGDVIELTRLIHGHGDKNAMTFFEAVKWLEGFSGTTVAPQAVKPAQRPRKQAATPLPEGDRFTFVKATPVTAKTHPNQLDYITKNRRIGLGVAGRHLWVITYKDNAAPFDDPMRGNRYGIGGPNDLGGYEVRAAQVNSNFKTALGPKDISSYVGEKGAKTGDIFEGRFDFLTHLELTNQTQPHNPTIILNSGRMAQRAAELIATRPEWQGVETWRIWQHHDNEGDTVTQTICESVNAGKIVGTMHHLYEGFNDLNECWTDGTDMQRRALQTLARGLKSEDKINTEPSSDLKLKF
jgi:hypothetical protein